ncbi:MAG: RecX family transcriptional regulator, partial [Pseudomonadota bacterium]
MAKIHQNKTNQKKPVTQQRLMNAASYYCARFEATQARLTRVLERKVRRWLQSHDIAEAQPLIAQTVERCVALGLVDDARYASLRKDQLLRKGQSAHRIAQDLRHKGLESAVAAQI